MEKISHKMKDLNGEKIVKVEAIRAEYGRTYTTYLCFTTESGKRVMLHGGEPHDPNPEIEDMRKASFFTPEEIGDKLASIERRKRQREKEDKERKMRELERLQRELGI